MSALSEMDRTKLICISVGAVLLVGAAVYAYKNRATLLNKESYMAAGAMDHLDSLDSRYELIESPDQVIPAEHFADLVDAGDQAKVVGQPRNGEQFESLKPLERLDRLQDKNMLPSTAISLPQYNIDVANPATYSFAVNAPRVILKNRLNMQADPFRGDVFIRYHPDIPLIAKSSNGRDSWRGDGFFSDHFAHLYNKLTGRAYKNVPLQTAAQGTILDYSSGE
jgi:hypothetical protein